MPERGVLRDPLALGSRAAELTGDDAFLQAMIDAELALTLSLVDAGLAPEWMTTVCEELADASRLDLASIAAGGRSGGTPVVPLVAALGAVAETVRGGASDHLHVGATSQDIIDTATMLVARQVVDEILAQLDTLADRFASLAEQHRDTLMAGRTLGQHASPTTFGFVVAGWLDAVLRARERLHGIRRSLPIQLGGAVGSLAVLSSLARTRLPGTAASHTVGLILGRFAHRLGLARPDICWHTDRVVIADLASALSIAAGVAGSFALEVAVLSRTEVAEVGERLSAGEGASSAMPHKRNPVTAVLVTAAARQTPGLVATLHASLLAEDQRPSGAWHAEWTPLRSLEAIAIAAVTGAADLASRLDVDRDRMRANLGLTNGLVFSESATTVLAETLGKKAAFDLVGRASRDAAASGRPLQAVLEEHLAAGPTPTGPDADSLRERVLAAFDIGRVDASDLQHTAVAIDTVVGRYRARPSSGHDERTASGHDERTASGHDERTEGP